MSRYLWAVGVVIFASLYLAFASYLPSDQKHSTAADSIYPRVHSLGSGYTFDPRDGWQTVNVSNLPYKHSPHSPDIHGATKIIASHTTPNTALGKLKGIIWKGLAGIGKPERVTITWYSGHDLLKPSCWENPVWAPTDNSFACALTQEGWTSKPKCLDFLELCNDSLKCVFVRVVDSCAGCPKGSKHVDLTRAAFSRLADLNMGVLQVQMRRATGPPESEWSEELWGPKQ